MSPNQISNRYWNHVLSNARYNDLAITITCDEAWSLFEKQNRRCALTGWPLWFVKDAYRYRRLQTASLDRIDSSKGYVKGNVQWVHRDLNTMKRDHDESYFIDICKAVAKHRGDI